MQKSNNQVIFWGCFIALITTAFGFITRTFLNDAWKAEFGLDDAQAGKLMGVGIWPFAVSIIGFSLIIDRIGYKTAMIIAFVGHITWAAMGVSAYFISQGGNKEAAYQMLYWGSLILGLANGTVEAFINPVVATMFNNNKPKWLNILHAGWPGGLVVAGIVTITMGGAEWWMKIAILAAPAVIYFLILLPQKFPVQERESAGVSYRDMLSEFGVLGALVVGFIITLQLMDFFAAADGSLSDTRKYLFIGIGAAIVIGFGLYTMSLGRFLMFFLILIMMPLATTEIGTDGWITSIMEPLATSKNFHAGWVLVYTSVIMMILRFFAGPIIKALSPLGLLTISAALAIVGLATLSFATGMMILVAATLYGFAKTFFWPTMLGVVSEQMPKGGALTLNAISGIGMVAVGTLGFPYIGTLKADKQIVALQSSEDAKKVPGLVVDGKLTPVEDKKIYEIIKYKAIDEKKLAGFFTETKTAGEMKDALEAVKKEDAKKSADDALKLLAVFFPATHKANERKAAVEKAVKEENKDIKDDELKKKVESDAEYKKIVESELYKSDAAFQDAYRKYREKSEEELNSKYKKLVESDSYKAEAETQKKFKELREGASQGALLNMAIFPAIMLVGYIILLLYFKSKGGYKPVVIGGGAH